MMYKKCPKCKTGFITDGGELCYKCRDGEETKIDIDEIGERGMKNGTVIYAKTHAEFLNKAFGTEYKAWMKSVWTYDDDWVVWMVRFNEVKDGWRNTFVSASRIKEENLKGVGTWGGRPISVDKKKIVIQVEDLGYTRKYTCKGRYIYDKENSDPNKVRYYNKYSD